jgi:hypothetical protein
MTEYVTQPLSRECLLNELAFVCSRLTHAGIAEVQMTFGWDCNLAIDDMWQDHTVSVGGMLEFVHRAEQDGIVEVGKGDIFVHAQDFSFMLCHEGDAHVEGEGELVSEVLERWTQLDYRPCEVKPRT